VLTPRGVRKFSRLARAHVARYAGVGGVTYEYANIERMSRNALDLAGKFIDEAGVDAAAGPWKYWVLTLS
jgi:hypothetical protein